MTDDSNLIDAIIAYESECLSGPRTIELFAHLIRTGKAWQLQGSYGRTAKMLIDEKLISPRGIINHKLIESRLQS